jgi:hypothetical protein
MSRSGLMILDSVVSLRPPTPQSGKIRIWHQAFSRRPVELDNVALLPGRGIIQPVR